MLCLDAGCASRRSWRQRTYLEQDKALFSMSVLRRRVRKQKELEALSQRMRGLEQDNALCKL